MQEISSTSRRSRGPQEEGDVHAARGKPEKVDKFTTEVPAFIDTARLTKLLDDQNVVVNAKAPDNGRSPC